MYQGKHHKRFRRISRKFVVLLASLFLLLTVTVGGTIAILMDSKGPLTDLFNPSQVTTRVEESVSGNTKSNVKIQNTGDTDAWIRATVIVTWQDKDGNVYGKRPVKDTDYDITWWDSGWLSGEDGFYYHETSVKPEKEDAQNCTTAILINNVSPKISDNNTEANALGYYLTVEIIGSGIQSKPASVFNTEWTSSGLEVKTEDQDGNDLPPEQWILVSN